MADARKKKTTKPVAYRKPTARDRKRGYHAADQVANDLKKLTPEKRRARIAELSKYLLDSAPALAVAESDPLKLLMLIGAEFVARYYPDATGAGFFVHYYGHQAIVGAKRKDDWYISLPVPVPAATAPMTAEHLRATVRAYCDQHLPGWRNAMVHLPSVGVRVGDIADFNDESLLITPEK